MIENSSKAFAKPSFERHRHQTMVIAEWLRFAHRPDLNKEACKLDGCAKNLIHQTVQRSDGSVYQRYRSRFCRSRFCALCMHRRQAKKTAQLRDTILDPMWQSQGWKWVRVTLTYGEVTADGLSDVLAFLKSHFCKLLRRRSYQRGVKGVIYSIEPRFKQRSDDTDPMLFSPHVHALVLVEDTDLNWATDWTETIGAESFRSVTVETATSSEAVGWLSYITKPELSVSDNQQLYDHGMVIAYCDAVKGLRLLEMTGVFRGVSSKPGAVKVIESRLEKWDDSKGCYIPLTKPLPQNGSPASADPPDAETDIHPVTKPAEADSIVKATSEMGTADTFSAEQCGKAQTPHPVPTGASLQLTSKNSAALQSASVPPKLTTLQKLLNYAP